MLGPVELFAVLGPFLLAIPERIQREAAFAIGLPALTLVWFAEPSNSSILRLIFAWAVFSGGVVLVTRVLESQRELEELVGQISTDDLRNAAQTQPRALTEAIDRELGRARRHARGFAVLSVAVLPRSIRSMANGFLRSETLQSLAENRAQLEMLTFLRAELHVYADVSIEGSRALALVPEIEGDALELLVERIKNSAEDTFEFEIQIGAARFPRDAVCAEELILAADRNRLASKLRSLPDSRAGQNVSDKVAQGSSDVQS